MKKFCELKKGDYIYVHERPYSGYDSRTFCGDVTSIKSCPVVSIATDDDGSMTVSYEAGLSMTKCFSVDEKFSREWGEISEMGSSCMRVYTTGPTNFLIESFKNHLDKECESKKRMIERQYKKKFNKIKATLSRISEKENNSCYPKRMAF